MIQSRYVTAIDYRVPYADTDQMGVVYYANYLAYFERVRGEMLRALDYTYLEMEKEGFMLPVVEAYCRYLKPAHYDDILKISGWFEERKAAQIKVRCEIHRSGVLLTSGHTIHVCLSMATQKPTRLPQSLIDRIPAI
jgi:acyl-CoA thioester hydrolase